MRSTTTSILVAESAKLRAELMLNVERTEAVVQINVDTRYTSGAVVIPRMRKIDHPAKQAINTEHR